MNDGASKQEVVAAALRERIRSGRYAAGNLIPTVRDLAERLGASVPTVSHALGLLSDEGFIVTDGRRGTRVVDHPPHRHRIGLVLPDVPDERGRYANLQWQALADAAVALSRDPATTIAIFPVLNRHAELPEHQRLLRALDHGAIAGLVVCEPFHGDAWLDLDALRLPVIGPSHAGRGPRGRIGLDQSDFRRRAIDLFHARGRRRLAAVMDMAPWSLAAVDQLRADAVARGLACPPGSILAAPLHAPGWARHAVTALMRGPARERPDALLVCDDNLAAEVEAGLDAVGVAERDLDLVVLANFPNPPSTRRVALRLGWDQREHLRLAAAAIAGWLDDRRPLGDITLPVRSGDEAPLPTPTTPHSR